ncbi:hypothetical protein D9613_011307 [Agrocybe pediades]|uniref:Uncharacterized protein n=1 Tax=Agrocybe pediades TaxID=84607 RepID=A0A8H4VN64_9AGAR|nr:hypothetical protein D9613_011307 [Agrocybe pediades]
MAVPGNMHCVVDVHAGNPSRPGARNGQISVVNATDPPVNLARASNEDHNVRNPFLCLWAWICSKVIPMLSAGIFPASKWCHYLFQCTPDEGATEESRREYLTRWEAALRAIAHCWKETQSIITYLLPISAFAILQLDNVLNNRAIFTLLAAAILLALASILSSFVYLLSKERFISRWKTLEAPDPAFWKCVAMPLDFAIWWALSRFCI